MFDCLKNISNSVVLVVSPLVSLMVEQVKSLTKRGVCCAIVSDRIIDQSFYFSEKDVDRYKVIFRSLLSTPVFSERIVTVAGDEAHCVSKW